MGNQAMETASPWLPPSRATRPGSLATQIPTWPEGLFGEERQRTTMLPNSPGGAAFPQRRKLLAAAEPVPFHPALNRHQLMKAAHQGTSSLEAFSEVTEW